MVDIYTKTAGVSFHFEEERSKHEAADKLIRSIYLERTPWSARKAAINDKMRCAYATLRRCDKTTFAWQSLLNHPFILSEFLSIEPVVSAIGPQAGNTYLDAMLHIAIRYHERFRPLEDWKPHTADPREGFAALVRHLFARFPAPRFMDESWFQGFTAEGELHRSWFLHIGVGQNIRTAECPIRLTKMAAHNFLSAPPQSSIVGALRYGQVTGLGGSKFLAEAIAESKLGTILPDETFWESVIHFFVNCQKMEATRVCAIIDYLYDRKFGEFPPMERMSFGDAIEPGMTMKGRKLEPLWERVSSWHEALAREEKRGKASWEPCGLQPLSVSETDSSKRLHHWSIVELCDSLSLQKEGSEMRHCVFTYRAGCLKGKTSIWSVRYRPDDGVKNTRLLTVEVDNSRHAIVQVKGKCNKTLSSFRGKERMQTAGEILKQWARERRLGIACSL